MLYMLVSVAWYINNKKKIYIHLLWITFLSAVLNVARIRARRGPWTGCSSPPTGLSDIEVKLKTRTQMSAAVR